MTLQGNASSSPKITIAAHAAERWASVVIPLIDFRTDPKRVRDWQRAVGASATSLRTTCAAAQWTAKGSLDFGRVLRAVHFASLLNQWDPNNLFDVADPRTLRRLLDCAGLSRQGSDIPSIDQLFFRFGERLHPAARQLLADALKARGTHAATTHT